MISRNNLPIQPIQPSIPEVDEVLRNSEKESFEKQWIENKILIHLRDKLRMPRDKDQEKPDVYEPQRLTRKICWQYNESARKVPLLRRSYI